MNSSQENKCHAIIHSAATLCAGIGAGLAQVPSSDSLLIVPVQVGMVISLGAVFGIDFDESRAKAMVATATATMVGRGLSQFLLGWIPVYGNALNASTAFAVTEAVGWAVANSFVTKAISSDYR
jgi:uncharacterized protein (DUF697 family)